MKEARIEVKGRVQGVRFRNNVKRFANELEIRGSVMNLPDGRVLIIAQGSEDKINTLIKELKENHGFSKVEDLDVNWSELRRFSNNDFRIVREGNFFIDQLKIFGRLFMRLFGVGDEVRFENVPKHICIIPDGNRRWARFKGLEPHFGHYRAGSYTNIEMLLKEAKRVGVKYVSIWGFSTENWKRSKDEKKALFDLILGGVNRFRKFAQENEIRFKHAGRKDRLPEKLIESLTELEKETQNYKGFIVQLCLDYGGRDEIIRAVNKILKYKVNRVDEKSFARFLDTYEMSDPDLIIRTSGEKRLSGFMPFQSVYAELYFSDVYFPDFGIKELHEAIKEYGKRQRRFGRG